MRQAYSILWVDDLTHDSRSLDLRSLGLMSLPVFG